MRLIKNNFRINCFQKIPIIAGIFLLSLIIYPHNAQTSDEITYAGGGCGGVGAKTPAVGQFPATDCIQCACWCGHLTYCRSDAERAQAKSQVPLDWLFNNHQKKCGCPELGANKTPQQCLTQPMTPEQLMQAALKAKDLWGNSGLSCAEFLQKLFNDILHFPETCGSTGCLTGIPYKPSQE
ncbi:MAG: hypothetical protein HY813_00445 [Candidatus Portnoybacteria bacterium]|nr:hypothetical protein [Candidatus Portnoybacteria bacterium]